MVNKFVIGAACLFILSACSATGPVFTSVEEPSNVNATVYIYRTHYFTHRNSFPYVHINGVQKDAIRDEGYLLYHVPPGKTAIEIIGDIWNWPPKVPLKIEPVLESRSTYFFRLRFEPIANGTRHIIEQVRREEAVSELRTKKLSK